MPQLFSPNKDFYMLKNLTFHEEKKSTKTTSSSETKADLLRSYLKLVTDPGEVSLDLKQRFRGHVLQFSIHLFVLHESAVTRRPETPRVGVNDVGQ